MLRLLSLLSSRRSWAGDELAERLEVTPRTVRRDVDKLRSLGYQVDAAPGASGGYRLRAGTALPPLLLDDEEAVAVAVGLRTAAGAGVTGIAEAAVRALAGLEQVLPKRLRPRVEALGAATVPLTGGGPTVDGDVLVLLAAACRDSERIRFGYTDGAGRSSQRHAVPHRLVHTGRRWYLVALDLDRGPGEPPQGEWRSYRADRVRAPRASGHRQQLADPPDAAAFVSAAVSTAPYRWTARVRLQAPVEVVQRRVPPTVGQLEAEGDDACVLTTGSDSLDAIAAHLAWLGVPFSVLSPPQLKAAVRSLGWKLVASADAS
nr:YafY family protein [Quadrisphaera sp. RL12-1S]